jgi:hypothetical protein
MTSLRRSTRASAFILMLALGACNSASMMKAAGYSDPRRDARIADAYEERDACMARNAAPSVNGGSDVATAARAVSLACRSETDRLIAVTNPHQAPDVTAAILRDNEAKAMRFVLLARGESRS